MIELKALSVGYAVPRHDFNVIVHSVFADAVNLKSINSSRLLTLVKSDGADLPQGMRIDTPVGFSFSMVLQAGERLICQNRVLQDEYKRISFDLRLAKTWQCKLPNLAVGGTTQNQLAAWNLIWQALNDRQRRSGAEIWAEELLQADISKRQEVSERICRLTRHLVEAVRKLDPCIEKIIAGLIGLGEGLTPSGDDFLVGFLTGLHCLAGESGERLKFLSELGKLVTHLSVYTNDISLTYLFYAANGQVSSRLAGLVDAIAQGEGTDHFWQTVEDAMRVGHSSGMDTVTGLLVGLSTWGDGFPKL